MRAPGINFVRGEWKPSKPTSSESPTSPALGVPFAPCSTTGATQCASISILPFFSPTVTCGDLWTRQRRTGTAPARSDRRAAAESSREPQSLGKQQRRIRAAEPAVTVSQHSESSAAGHLDPPAEPQPGKRNPVSSDSHHSPHQKSRQGPSQLAPSLVHTFQIHPSNYPTSVALPRRPLSPRDVHLPNCRVSCPIRPCPLLGFRLPHSRRGGPHIE